MIAHATEEHVTSASVVTSRSPAPCGQCHCNETRDIMPPTATEEWCFLLFLYSHKEICEMFQRL
jgi:hypothetical protein